MGKQLNLPLTDKVLPDTSLIAETITNQLSKITPCILKLTGKMIIFNADNYNMRPIRGWPSNQVLEVRKFPVISQPTVLASIDSSCIHIADVEDGVIYAARVAAVFFHDHNHQNHVRIGPIIFYLNEQNVSDLIEDYRLSKLILLEDSMAQAMIRVRLERIFVMELALSLSEGVIMIDGSLRNSIFDVKDCTLMDILDKAKEKGNRVIGISKSSKHRILNRLAGQLYSYSESPIYADIHQLISPIFRGVKGRILLVKFTDDGLVFRVDVGNFNFDTFKDTLSRVRYNDCFFGGYPESLRLAHHLSIFTRSEDTSIKSYLSKKVGIVELPAEDPRKIALGNLKIGSLR